MKKQTNQTKQTKMATEMTRAVARRNRRQRFFGVVALVGLFLCGYMLGGDIQKHNAKASVEQNVVSIDNVVPACEVIEKRLLANVLPDDTIDFNYPNHNVDIYKKLVDQGCPENKEKYEQMVQRETQIANALKRELVNVGEVEKSCTTIENILKEQVRYLYDPSAESHIDNAKIYANLSERGCPENSQKYVELAKQELEIARALEDDEMDHEETIEVVETYKRLKMQNAAQEILDKAKKITNPAIDFIIELEKIINE
jgi:predicted transcriptional regulator